VYYFEGQANVLILDFRAQVSYGINHAHDQESCKLLVISSDDINVFHLQVLVAVIKRSVIELVKVQEVVEVLRNEIEEVRNGKHEKAVHEFGKLMEVHIDQRDVIY
jgi:hypothetical protein